MSLNEEKMSPHEKKIAKINHDLNIMAAEYNVELALLQKKYELEKQKLFTEYRQKKLQYLIDNAPD